MPALKSLDDSIRPLASRNHSVTLKALRDVTQQRAAHLMGIVPSTFSDFAGDHLERACQVLAALGLKVVPASEITKAPDEMRYILRHARRQLDRELEELGEDTSPGALGPAE